MHPYQQAPRAYGPHAGRLRWSLTESMHLLQSQLRFLRGLKTGVPHFLLLLCGLLDASIGLLQYGVINCRRRSECW